MKLRDWLRALVVMIVLSFVLADLQRMDDESEQAQQQADIDAAQYMAPISRPSQ